MNNSSGYNIRAEFTLWHNKNRVEEDSLGPKFEDQVLEII